jgi:hypothetical protein
MSNNNNNNNANNNSNTNANINISNNIKQHVNINDFNIKDKLFVNIFPNFKKIWKLNMIRIKQFIEFTLDETTRADNIAKKYLKYLSKMNSLGFITINSQSDLKKINTDSEQLKKYLKKNRSDESSPHIIKYVEIQRAYINGFIPLKIYSQFVAKLDEISPYCYSIDLLKDNYDITLTEECVTYSDNTNKCVSYSTLTTDAFDESERNFEIEQLYTIGPQFYGGGVEGLVIKENEWVFVTVLDTRFSHDVEAADGLFTSVIKALEESLKANTKNKNRKFNKTVKNRNNRNKQ